MLNIFIKKTKVKLFDKLVLYLQYNFDKWHIIQYKFCPCLFLYTSQWLKLIGFQTI